LLVSKGLIRLIIFRFRIYFGGTTSMFGTAISVCVTGEDTRFICSGPTWKTVLAVLRMSQISWNIR